MVTVSSAFISARREMIILRVLSASGCAFKAAACVDVLRAVLAALGKTDLDNTDVARDHSFHCIASAESLAPGDHTTHVGLTVSIFQWMPSHHLFSHRPPGSHKPLDDRFNFKPVRKTQAGARRSESVA